MQFMKNNLIPLIILCGIVLAILIPVSPLYMSYTHRDSGVFLYTGWRITEGEVPYRDIWDHKPPVIFYINALGMLLTKGSRWGVWIIECSSLLVTSIVGYFVFSKIFDRQTALINMVIFDGSLHFILTGGNMTNEYVLPMQMISLFILLRFDKGYLQNKYWILLGLMAALAFFTKQTAISLWIAILIYHVINSLLKGTLKRWLIEMIFFGIGGGLITAAIMGYFWVNDGLVEFINAAFKYNYVYASLGMSLLERIDAFSVNFSALMNSGILILGIIGIVCCISFLQNTKITFFHKNKPIFIIGLISLPIEVFFISLSGRGYDHYFISMLPLLSIFSGMTLWLMFRQISELIGSTKKMEMVVFSMLVLIIFTLYQPYVEENKGNQWIDDSFVVNYIQGITSTDDSVLIWGAEAKDYFATKRTSATKYVYLYPLYTQNYANEERINDFLDDIIENQPKIILDTKSPDMPFLSFAIESNEIDSRIKWIENNYYELEPLGSWTVYKRNKE